MSSKALITARALDSRTASNLGVRIEHRGAAGTLVTSDETAFAALEAQGFRVKLLLDTNILHVAGYRIDTLGPPTSTTAFEVPEALERVWPHHLVQLIAPPTVEWVRAIEARGVTVVEPVSAYGLFVVAAPDVARALTRLPFVSWVGPFKPAYRIAPDLLGLTGTIRYVNVGVLSDAAVPDLRDAVRQRQGTVLKEWEPGTSYRDDYRVLIVEIDAAHLPAIAALPAVRWLEFQPPKLNACDERSVQILTERFDMAGAPFTAPVPGYQLLLNQLGLSGAGVVVGICDSGVDTNDNATMHPDLKGRLAFFVDRTNGKTLIDGWTQVIQGNIVVQGGHGTHVAGLAVGNAATAVANSKGFLLGQGVAPGASFGVLNPIDTPGSTGTDPVTNLVQTMAIKGANVMNNSWGHGGAPGYSAKVADIDRLVRDPNPASPALDRLAIVFAAGNSGPAPKTIQPPHESKNTILVGGTDADQGSDHADIRHVWDASSRGPAQDGRLLPTVVAPAAIITSVRTTVDADPNLQGVQRPMVPVSDPFIAKTYDDYTFDSGTSMAAPHVSGLCALLIEWWRKRTGGAPSAAMLKALLINGAEDLGGPENWHRFFTNDWIQHAPGISRKEQLGFIPNRVIRGNQVLTPVNSLNGVTNLGQQWFYDQQNDVLYVGKNPDNAIWVRDAAPAPGVPNNNQGWGRVSLPNIVLRAPDSDRGPKIFSDQRHAFTANGQEHLIRVAPVDTMRPLRITLVWTDPPGAANFSPALKNDLDLEVKELMSGDVYKGNVFANGFSVVGGNFDHLNNVECVYVEHPKGTYEVRVIAAALTMNARPPFDMTPWQDFALVIDNAEVPAAAPVSVVPVIDRSGSMVGSGYVGITVTASKQFVDLMQIDDAVAVVSFSDDAVVEYPAGPNPSLQTIAGQPVRDAAKAGIDAVNFFGCTFMGDGILKARDLLQPAVGSRAMLLLSDGYDNKGCDELNPNKPSALDAVAQLPAKMPIYTCAMGPDSDQVLLAKIAADTKGLYYYMPAIDELFEIYNYIRGQVTGTGIIANESAMASSSRVGAFVDAGATAVSFTVAWADPGLRVVDGDPQQPTDVSVRLRTPNGDLLHSACSYVKRVIGDGYVVFQMEEPLPGQWYVEVSAQREDVDDERGGHLRYTVGGFVTSPLRLLTFVGARRVAAGKPIKIGVTVLDDNRVVNTFRADAAITKLTMGIRELLATHKTRLDSMTSPPLQNRDAPPTAIARLLSLRDALLKEGKPDLFVHSVVRIPLRHGSRAELSGLRLGSRSAAANALVGQLATTTQAGSYNVVVTASGLSPASGRFVRKDLVSVLVT